MSKDFSGRIAVVTGASRGLGFHCARELASRGAHVYALARTLGGLEELDDAIARGDGVRPTLLPLDLTDDGGVDRLGGAIHERHGRLDILVHAAINAPPLSPVGHVAAKDLDAAMALNARAVQRVVRSLDPLLEQSDAGRALFFEDPHPDAAFWSAYHATKAAGLAFARAWASERASSPLNIMFESPPPMATAMRARFFPGEDAAKLASPTAVAAQLISRLA